MRSYVRLTCSPLDAYTTQQIRYTNSRTGTGVSRRRYFCLGVRWPVRLLVLASGRRGLRARADPAAALAAGTPPPQPLGLNHQTHASNLITLTWDPTPAATSYRLNRGTSSGDEGATPIATTTNPTYTDTNLSSTTAYFYEVTAVNSAEEIPPSVGAGATRPGVVSRQLAGLLRADSVLHPVRQWSLLSPL
jgi:hypothetical protein